MSIRSHRRLSLFLCCTLITACGRKPAQPVTPPAPPSKTAANPSALTEQPKVDPQAEAAEKARQAQVAAEAAQKAEAEQKAAAAKKAADEAEAKAKAVLLQAWKKEAYALAATEYTQAVDAAIMDKSLAIITASNRQADAQIAIGRELAKKEGALELQLKTLSDATKARDEKLQAAYLKEKNPQKQAELGKQRAANSASYRLAVKTKDDTVAQLRKEAEAATAKTRGVPLPALEAAFQEKCTALWNACNAKNKAIDATKEVTPQELSQATKAAAEAKTKAAALKAWKEKASGAASSASMTAQNDAHKEFEATTKPIYDASAARQKAYNDKYRADWDQVAAIRKEADRLRQAGDKRQAEAVEKKWGAALGAFQLWANGWNDKEAEWRIADEQKKQAARELLQDKCGAAQKAYEARAKAINEATAPE